MAKPNIVYAVRSEYREVSVSLAPAEEGGESTTALMPVADYCIVVCHDKTCPGLEVDGHLAPDRAGDRSHHHDFRFLSDARPEKDLFAEVQELEEQEAKGASASAKTGSGGLVALKLH